VPGPARGDEAWLAVLPVLEPLAVKVKTEQGDCPVSPTSEDCALVEAGEGCEIVVAVDGAPAPDPGSGAGAPESQRRRALQPRVTT
jgi:hypothetical protein